MVSVQTQPERKTVLPDMKPKSIAYYWLLLVSVQTQPERKTVFPDMKPKSITYYWFLLVSVQTQPDSKTICPDMKPYENYNYLCLSRHNPKNCLQTWTSI